MSYHLRTVIIAAIIGGTGYALFRARLSRIAAVVRSRPKVLSAIIVVLALLPVIWTTRNVLHYAVNVPRLDDWEMAALIVKQHAGELRWHDLFEQQQEARTVLPKLIFLVSAAGGEWDVREQMALSLVAAALSAVGVMFLLRRSRLSSWSFAVVLWIAVFCIFSPAQVEVWLLASGFPSFLPACFLVGALVALRSRIPIAAQFVICVVLSIAGSFTLAHGLLAWALTFPLLLATYRIRHWPWWLGAWSVAAAACAVVYFWGYAKPAYLPEVAPRVGALDYIEFFLIFVGGGFAYASTAHPAVVGLCAGALLLALLLAAITYLLGRVADERLRSDAAPWLALAGYSIGAACLATIGRVGYGSTYSLASRYVPFSIYLTIADAALIAIICRELPGRRLLRSGNTALCVAFLVLYARASATTLYFMRHDSATARLTRGALLFSRVIDATPVLAMTYPSDPKLPARLAAQLDDAQLLRPPLVRSAILDDLPRIGADAVGELERRFGGWTALLRKTRPADCVLLAYENPAHQSVAFAVSDTLHPRYDIVKRFRENDLLWSGWSVTANADALPPGAKISAWAVDADTAKTARLPAKQQNR